MDKKGHAINLANPRCYLLKRFLIYFDIQYYLMEVKVKKIIIYFLSISMLIILSGCTHNRHDNLVKPINKELSSMPEISSTPTSSISPTILTTSSLSLESDDTKNTVSDTYKIGVFYLGMNYEDLLELNLYNTDDEITEITKINEEENSWDYGNKVIWTQNLCCLFDKDDTIYKITVNGNIPTSLGLKVGDTTHIVDTLYGTCDYQYENDWGKVYEYIMDSYYIDISILDNEVSNWSISKYKNDYNGKNMNEDEAQDKALQLVKIKFKAKYYEETDDYAINDNECYHVYIWPYGFDSRGFYEVRICPSYYPLSVFYYCYVDLSNDTITDIGPEWDD
jgi:hypothetical protein